MQGAGATHDADAHAGPLGVGGQLGDARVDAAGHVAARGDGHDDDVGVGQDLGAGVGVEQGALHVGDAVDRLLGQVPADRRHRVTPLHRLGDDVPAGVAGPAEHADPRHVCASVCWVVLEATADGCLNIPVPGLSLSRSVAVV